jgi:pimeloyl-ACP methyl ester carboxylesterase
MLSILIKLLFFSFSLPLFIIRSYLNHPILTDDPLILKKLQTPILLIHGSGSNNYQWGYFRKFIEDNETGHVFSINLNKKPFKNDFNSTMEYYSIILHKRIMEIKLEYQYQLNYHLTDIILIGHSMGGLVAGHYSSTYSSTYSTNFFSVFFNNFFNNKIHIKILITMNTPWKGSPFADYWFTKNNTYPSSYFLTNNTERIKLYNEVSALTTTKIYCYGTEYDEFFPYNNSLLNINKTNTFHDTLNDHYTSMVDKDLAIHIKNNWIKNN